MFCAGNDTPSCKSGDAEVVILNVATARQQTFTLPALPSALSWAPDGGSLAVTNERQVLLLDAINGSTHEILATTSPQGFLDAAWSPDKNWIVFSDSGDLTRVRPDGSGRVTVVSYSHLEAPQRFVWSPNATRFAFTANSTSIPPARPDVSSFTPDLFVSDLGLMARDVATGALNPAWSPAGDRIAFFHGDPQGEQVQVVNADGSGLRTIGGSPGGGTIAFAPSWSPNDEFVAFPTRNGVHVVNLTTGEDLTAVRGPGYFTLTSVGAVMCDTLVVGWASDTSLVTLTQCQGSGE